MLYMQHRDANELISATQVASKLGVTSVTVQRWVRNGKLPAKKLPGRNGAYVFDADEIDRMIRQEQRAGKFGGGDAA